MFQGTFDCEWRFLWGWVDCMLWLYCLLWGRVSGEVIPLMRGGTGRNRMVGWNRTRIGMNLGACHTMARVWAG